MLLLALLLLSPFSVLRDVPLLHKHDGFSRRRFLAPRAVAVTRTRRCVCSPATPEAAHSHGASARSPFCYRTDKIAHCVQGVSGH